MNSFFLLQDSLDVAKNMDTTELQNIPFNALILLEKHVLGQRDVYAECVKYLECGKSIAVLYPCPNRFKKRKHEVIEAEAMTKEIMWTADFFLLEDFEEKMQWEKRFQFTRAMESTPPRKYKKCARHEKSNPTHFHHFRIEFNPAYENVHYRFYNYLVDNIQSHWEMLLID